ncbi:FUN14 family protein [Stagonosporopsis vannaccii]|nr:FUN14 family protein [Stagonosporopsis vannaccii]
MSPHSQLASKALRSSFQTPTRIPRNAPIERQLSAYIQQQLPPPAPTMSFLLPGLRRGALLATPIVLSTPLLVHNFRHTPAIRCDSADPLAKLGDIRNTYARDAQTPVITQSGAPNPKAVRQISMGSILGVIGGLGVSVFSKPLAILLGLGIVALQFIESRGIHIIPYSYLQRRFKSTNVRSLVQDDVAFKLSFGLTFALAAFAEF